MHYSIKSAVTFLMMGLVVSCSQKDHNVNPEPASCKYAGLSYVIQNQYYSSKTTGTSNTDIIQTNDRLPLEIKTSVHTMENDTIQSELYQEETIEEHFEYQYNAEGYLVQEIFLRNSLVRGGSLFKMFYLDKGPVSRLETKLTRTKNFTYEKGWLSEVIIKENTVYTGDNLPPETRTSTTGQTYSYDAQHKLVSVTDHNTGNYKTISYYTGEMITSAQHIRPDGTRSDIIYKNENGKKSQYIDGNATFNFKYDVGGNLLRLQVLYIGRPSSMQEYQYDNNVNPQSLLSTRFKGMPLPFLTIQTTDGVNNVTQSIFTSYGSDGTAFVTEENTSFTYNGENLPTFSTSTINTGGGIWKRETTYKYTDCQ